MPLLYPGAMNTMLHLSGRPGARRCVKLWFTCFVGLTSGISMPAAAAEAPGIVTIVDADAGQASVIRGVARLQLAEGVRVAADDIVETGSAARLARLEFADGSSLNLGPETRIWLAPRLPAERSKPAFRFYLLQGWAKLEAPAAGTLAFASPAFDAAGSPRAVVAMVAPDAAQVFAETGEIRLQPTGGAAALALKSGELWARAGGAKASVTPRPTPSFIQQVPRAFLDTLPARAERFKGREVVAKPLPEPAYAELQPWLDAEPALRKAMQPRWRPLARNAEFRKGLVAGMAAHPEWERVLFPEKYLPRPAGTAATPQGANTTPVATRPTAPAAQPTSSTPTRPSTPSGPAPAPAPMPADPYKHSPFR